MTIYLFFRGDEFYPLTLVDDEDAIQNALCNPMTTKVTTLSGRLVFEGKESIGN